MFYLLSPLIVGSQLVGGFILSYIRIKLGFTWSVIQHGVFNLVLFVSVTLLFHNAPLIVISEDNLSMSITELVFVDKDSTAFSSSFDLFY